MVEPTGTRPPVQAATEEELLATKLHIAEPRPGFLPRPRLLELLTEVIRDRPEDGQDLLEGRSALGLPLLQALGLVEGPRPPLPESALFPMETHPVDPTNPRRGSVN